MRDRTLILLRGLPGSAKSTLARTLAPGANFAADDFFEVEGLYRYDGSKIREAHQSCMDRAETAMAEGVSVVAVHNTFSKAWEARPYLALAANYNYSVFVIECQNDFGNVHGVPASAIQSMRERWEPLTGEALPLTTIIRTRFWNWYYDTKRKIKGLFA